MSLAKKIHGKLGFGAGPLGNLFQEISDDDARATIDSAWELGIRYFDTAPFYGAGLSEHRLGQALAGRNRQDFTLSSKVGRLISDEISERPRTGLFANGRKNKLIIDYSADATYRSIEQSLKRLNTDTLDIVWVHDVDQNNFGDEWIEHFNTARKGAFRALAKLKSEGTIKGWGLGVNRVEPCELILDLDEPKPDGFLLAGRYTLLEHTPAAQRLMAKSAMQGVNIVIGGPYSSGVLVGGKYFEYQPASVEILERVQKITQLANSLNVDVKAAALQFALAHPNVVSVIPGASKPSRVAEDQAAVSTEIPADFWRQMKANRLISEDAVVPSLQ